MDAFVQKFVKARLDNSTDASYPSKVPTLTQPSGAGVVNPPRAGEGSRKMMQIVPFGTDAADEVFGIRIIGWRQTGGELYIPIKLAELTCTLGTTPGVATADIDENQFFADTIAVAFGNDKVDVEFLSPGDNTVASAIINTKGCPYVEILFDMNSTASGNALIAWV